VDLAGLCKAGLDDEILSFDVTKLAHALKKRRIASRVDCGLARAVIEEPDAPDFALFLGKRRQGRERAQPCAARNKKFATRLHWITPAARPGLPNAASAARDSESAECRSWAAGSSRHTLHGGVTG
jgi:hypothetical protein